LRHRSLREAVRAWCECGRPDLVLGRFRRKSSKSVRAGKPVSMPDHYLCIKCFRKQNDRERNK
jgi:hypothetical protein